MPVQLIARRRELCADRQSGLPVLRCRIRVIGASDFDTARMYKPLDIQKKYCWLMCQSCDLETLVQEGSVQPDLACPDCGQESCLASVPLGFVKKPIKYNSKLELFHEGLSVLWDPDEPPARIARYRPGNTLLLRPVVGWPQVSYDAQQALDDLEGVPDIKELERLFLYYPKYKHQLHRADLLHGVLAGHGHFQILKTWIEDKGQKSLKGQQKGGPGKSVPSKIKRLVIRLLYLRHRFNGVSQVDANKDLGARFRLGPSAIAKITTSKILDQKLGDV